MAVNGESSRPVRLTRVVRFSAGHRFWDPDLSAAENKALYGEWASPFNHGHNYVLSATYRGRVDREHGMVVNIKDIDDFLQEAVVVRFGGKSFNDEVPEYATRVPTLENLIRDLSVTLARFSDGVELIALRLEEMPDFWAEWEYDMTNTVRLTRSYEFAASHRLHCPDMSHEQNLELFGKCNNPAGHGHNYILQVTVEAEPDPKTGMALDLGEFDKVVESEVVDRYDHKNFNEDIPEFAGMNPTSEVVVQEIYNRLSGKVPGRLHKVRLEETARNIFEVVSSDE